MADQTFVFTIFIESSPDRLWRALTDGSLTSRYWAGRRIESDWEIGAPVHLYIEDTQEFEVHGQVLEYDPPQRLSYTWMMRGGPAAETASVSFDVHPMGDSVRLTITHAPLAENDMARQGWSAILSSLKSYLETGKPLSATEMWRRRAA